MAPSPAAGKKPQTPSTPTKAGKNPASSATPKLGQASGKADAAKGAAKDASETPKQATGGAVDKTKQQAGGDGKSPKLPPRPKAGQAGQGKGPGTPKPPKLGEAKKKAEDTAQSAKGKVEETSNDADVGEPEPSDNDIEHVTGDGSQDSPDIETAEDASSSHQRIACTKSTHSEIKRLWRREITRGLD